MKFFQRRLSLGIVGLILLVSFGWTEHINAQQKRLEYSYLAAASEFGKEIKAIDLSEEVHRTCNKTLRREIGNSYIELKFPAALSSKIKNLADSLEKSIRKTQEMLFPLKIDGVRFYLLQKDEIPLSYKMTDDLAGQKFYLHLWVFDNVSALNLECDKNDELCSSVYSTIPHELTHDAIENLTNHDNLKWFEEGLANYVGYSVRRDYGRLTKFDENIPKVALHRAEIRDSLWTWNNNENKKDIYSIRNRWFKYKASEQLIKLVVEKSKNNGIENPLEVLFNELEKFREENGKSASADDLILIIQQKLKVDPKKLGVLDKITQKNLVKEAMEILSQTNPNESDKYYALIILASVDEIPLSEDSLKLLIKNVYTTEKNGYLQNLAATALFRRIGQDNFDEAVKSFLNENSDLKQLNLKSIKSNLEKLSIRPAKI